MAADPAWRAAQREGARAKFADPAHRAKHRAVLLERNQNRTPAMIEAQREHGRRVAREVLSRPELRAIVDDPAMKAANGRKRTATTLAWCPPEYRDTYRQLKASQRLRAAVARRLILDLIKADRARWARTGQLPQAARAAAANQTSTGAPT